MSGGFSKHAGPTGPSLSQPRFGTSPPPPPSPSSIPRPIPARSPRSPETVGAVQSSTLAYENFSPAASFYQSAGLPRRPEALQRVRSPPVAFHSTNPAPSSPLPAVGAHRPTESPPGWVNGQRSIFNDDGQTNPRSSAVTSFVASRNSGTKVTAKISRFQDLKRTKSPPSCSTDGDTLRTSQTFLQNSSDLQPNNGNHFPPRTRSPPLAFENHHSADPVHPLSGEDQQPVLSPFEWGNQPKFPRNFSNSWVRQDQSSTPAYVGSHDSGRAVDNRGPKRTRSPPVSLAGEVLEESTRFNESKRPSVSPHGLGTRSALSSTSDSQFPERILPSAYNTVSEAKNSTFSVAKRTLSPPLLSSDKVSQGDSISNHDGTEREIQAKAKRLARFKVELSEDLGNTGDNLDQRVSMSRHEQPTARKQDFTGYHLAESARDFNNGNTASDFEGLETSSIIVGLCPDMCPESERAERERKGDLDQYERLDGDRNQTNKFLAVKKYNRTAEREASLIRPMPILQRTVDYLLDLLDQPYDDRFLGMYNFLWDRMRAIRMDLRMQHIFDQEAIIMLEQMIRLHIIAMHELCEYTKGEGFSEGFDAHLNIEQMNKTSVELFQMYDDHRKKGINVPTENEFRGYYALLKLDKHPGYKVEPAELSLDLAKMTPEIRQTPEILFARDVARACRTGNFIAFFRLARKASYLQACLMHAHFAKLRTQALASLHSGLQNNQGIPVSHVAKWLAMEDENIEDLLEYHGFLIKEFEEPYMVKEGPFLSADKDYPTKCSKLVHLKKSRSIVEDVSSTPLTVSLPVGATKQIQLPKHDIKTVPKVHKHDIKASPFTFGEKHDMKAAPKVYKHDKIADPFLFGERKSFIDEEDKKMPDSEVLSPKVGTQVLPVIGKAFPIYESQDDQQVVDACISPWSFPFAHSSPVHQYAKHGIMEKPALGTIFRVSRERKIPSDIEGISWQIAPPTASQEGSPRGKYGYSAETSIPQILVISGSKDEEAPEINEENESDEVVESYDDVVFQAKLKLIIRLWRRYSSRQRELREQRQMAANAAMSSLSLGPPIRQKKEELGTGSKFDIDHVMRERYEKLKQSWSTLNVSDAVAHILGRRNPSAKCLCWKLILCSQINEKERCELWGRNRLIHVEASSWLSSKLMPSENDNDEDSCDTDLLISSPGVSIWKKWVPSQSIDNMTCCLSVVKDHKFDDITETVAAASAIVFLVFESIPWNLQRIKLHDLLSSIPSGSFLPLLVLTGSYNKEISDPASIIISELGLLDIDKSRVSSFLVVSLVEDKQESTDGFFSDMQLREGLKWLASKSPPQPDIDCITMRELVLSHLDRSLAILDNTSDYHVDPSNCVSAFNEALDWSIGEIAAAAKANPTNWPCPEITLLEHSDEHMMVKWYLPSIGWSSTARIEQLLCALKGSKLPDFPAISWLDKGANTADEIENSRLQLENCLIRYLTQSSGMMGLPLAMKEANVMLQRSSRLELHGSSYFIVPRWIMIFRRIMNWRIMGLSSGELSSAYVLKHHYVDPTSRTLDESSLERSAKAPYFSLPSLDEMIDAGCRPLISGKDQPQPEAFQPLPRGVSSDMQFDANTVESSEDEGRPQNGNLLITDDIDLATSVLNSRNTKIAITGKATGGADKLSKLLEQCNIMQNSIEEKLSIYF